MSRIRKRLICPYFGDLPAWYPLWLEDIQRLEEHGYHLLISRDPRSFHERVKTTLGVSFPDGADQRKPCAYRPAFGVMYADEINGYDFWGHTDLDCVYGRVQRFVTDEFLAELDFHTDESYLCGPWTLYRNTPVVNDLFRRVEDWQERLEDPAEVGWGETAFTETIDRAHTSGEIRRAYTHWHAYTVEDLARLRRDGDRLVCEDREVMMGHFRRTKTYPAQLVRA